MPPRRSAAPASAGPPPAETEARKALLLALADPSPRPLSGTKASPGFFTGSSALVKSAGELCVERGWVEATGESAGTGKSARPLYRLTPAGIRHALGGLDAPGREAVREVIGRLERVAATLHQVLGPLRDLLGEPTAAAGPAPAPLAPVPTPAAATPPAATPATARPLREVLREQYDYLCKLVEFKDGLVDLPRLYDKAKAQAPGLTPDIFHREVRELWEGRTIELHRRNEIRGADRPELGILRDGHLYYHVAWRTRS